MVSIHHQETHRCRLYRSPRSNPARPPPGRSDLCVPHREARSVGLDPDRREPCPDALAILPGEDPGSGRSADVLACLRAGDLSLEGETVFYGDRGKGGKRGWPLLRRPDSPRGVREGTRSIRKLITGTPLLDEGAIERLTRTLAIAFPPK